MHKRSSYRSKRIAYEIHRNISIIIQQKIHDSRIGSPTISDVCISKDFKNATIFVIFFEKKNTKEIQSAVEILQQASRFIRFLLAKTINFRIVPSLWFKYDSSLIDGVRLYNIISQLNCSNDICNKDMNKCKDT